MYHLHVHVASENCVLLCARFNINPCKERKRPASQKSPDFFYYISWHRPWYLTKKFRRPSLLFELSFFPCLRVMQTVSKRLHFIKKCLTHFDLRPILKRLLYPNQVFRKTSNMYSKITKCCYIMYIAIGTPKAVPILKGIVTNKGSHP